MSTLPKLSEHYELLHKIGVGKWSQVFLGKRLGDTTSSDPPYAAIKILSAEATSMPEYRELEWLRRLTQFSRDTTVVPVPHLPVLFGTYSFSDDQGYHLCLAESLYSESIESWRRKARGQKLSWFAVRVIIQRLLEALSAVHKAGLIHTGQISSQREGFRAQLIRHCVRHRCQSRQHPYQHT